MASIGTVKVVVRVRGLWRVTLLGWAIQLWRLRERIDVYVNDEPFQADPDEVANREGYLKAHPEVER
jgi:hypothetical protein